MDFGRIWAPKLSPKCSQNIHNLFLGFSFFLLVLHDLRLPASGFQYIPASAFQPPFPKRLVRSQVCAKKCAYILLYTKHIRNIYKDICLIRGWFWKGWAAK